MASYDTLHPHGILLNRQYDVVQQPRVLIEHTPNSPAVAAVLVRSDTRQILCGFSAKRQVWDIPQGLIESGEGPAQAAARELFEEANIFVHPTELTLVSETIQLNDSFVFPWKTSIFMPPNGMRITSLRNNEPGKISGLAFYAPIQIPQPRGLSLRIALSLLGDGS